jgi:hypothetical protein
MKITLRTCQKDHPYRPANWRWERSRFLQQHGRATPNREKDDEWVHKACYLRHYLSKAASDIDRCRAVQAAGDLGIAYDLWDEEIAPTSEPGVTPPRVSPSARVVSAMRHELEARILTGAPLADIAKAMCISPGGIKAYETVFFNVLDRLESSAYIAHQAIGPGLQGGQGSVEAAWKIIGWSTRNPRLLDEIITGCRRNPPGSESTLDDVYAFAAQNMDLSCMIKSMLAARMMTIDDKTSGRLLAMQRKLVTAHTDESRKDPTEELAENLRAAFAALKFTVGQKSEFIGKNGEPRAHELLAAASGGPKLSEIKSNFEWPEPGATPEDD